jgi:O-antigen/teichoic acid export membrane protein
MTRDRALWTAAMANEATVLAIIWVMIEKPGWGGAIAAIAIAYAVGVLLAARLTREPASDAAPVGESAL